MSEIHKATERGKYDRVKELLEQDPSLVHARTEGLVAGDQPLHFAAWQGRKKIAELLLDSGAEIDARGDGGRTPLHYAVEERSPAVVKLLVERGADLNVKKDVGCTALYMAAASGETRLVKVLLEAGAEKDLNSAIHIDGAAKTLEQLAADPSAIEEVERPETLLNDAIRVASTELAKYLLDHGLDANQPGWTALPPIFDALATRNIGLVRALLEHGADISAKDHVGRSVLKYAGVYSVGDEVISLLKERGATE